MKRKVLLAYIIIAVFMAGACLLAIQIFPFQSIANMTIFIVTVTSFVISMAAFIISLRTYFSIDSVNVITRMEGNVLEHSNYVTSFPQLISEYGQDCSEGISKVLFKTLEKRLSSRLSTATEFASNLQYFIDMVVVFPFLFNQADENQDEHLEKMNQVINLIGSRAQSLLAVSSGNMILIEETVKLIRGVVDYLMKTNKNSYKMSTTLLEVRGTLLKNAITQTVYYDYLGLFYNKKAMYIILERMGLSANELFEIRTLKMILNDRSKLTDEDIELVGIYLNESLKAYKRALEICGEDLMWQSFMHANYARSLFFLEIFMGTEESWIDSMNRAILCRRKTNMLVKDLLNPQEPEPHLQKAFVYQEYLSRLMKMNMLIAQGLDITDTRNISIYRAPDYKGIEKDKYIKEDYCGPFARIAGYQKAIREMAAANASEN